MNHIIKLHDLVQFTGAHAFQQIGEPKDPTVFNKWLAVWTLGLSGEIAEVAKANNPQDIASEIGDVCWYTMALDTLLGGHYEFSQLPLDGNYTRLPSDVVYDCLLHSLEYAETAKKFIRDYPERGTVDTVALKGYARPLEVLSIWFPLADAIDAVDTKLRRRYSNGFSAKQSVNRHG